MTTLRTRIEGMISTYNNKAPCALHEMNKDADGVFIGLRTLPQGFYVYTLNSSELQKYFTVKSVTTERSGPTKELYSTLNRCSRFNIECLYDTGIRTSYSALLSELKIINGAFVPSDLIKHDEFLKKLFESEEPVKSNKLNFEQRLNELGMDETEIFETFSYVMEEKQAQKEGRELDDEFDDDEDESG